MKREIQVELTRRFAASVCALLGSGLLSAHPGAAEHVTAAPPAHGMIHALMDSPAAVVAASLALSGLWLLVRKHRDRHDAFDPARAPELNRE